MRPEPAAVPETGDGLLALRIDVDVARGLHRAVPRMAARLAEAGMAATFFVVAGHNRAARARLLLEPARLARLWRLNPWRVATRVGGGGGPMLVAAGRRAVRAIVEAGSEVAVHGWAHAWWADHAWDAPPARLAREIDRAFEALGPLAGCDVPAWGSPNWRTRPEVVAELVRRSVPYLAECWGRGPFRTGGAGAAAAHDDAPPHLPITLPSLETLGLVHGLAPCEAAGRLLDARRPGAVEVACLHDYWEGLLCPEAFEALLDGCRRRGLRTVTLREAAGRVRGRGLPVHGLCRGPLPGFAGDVSWQAAPGP